MSRRNPKPHVIKRGGHEVDLDPPYVFGGSAKSGWNMRLNGRHIPLWPRTAKEGREWAKMLLEAITRGAP